MKIIRKENRVSRSTKNNGYRRRTIGYRSPCIFLWSDFHGNLSTLNVTTPSYLGRFHAEIYVSGFAPGETEWSMNEGRGKRDRRNYDRYHSVLGIRPTDQPWNSQVEPDVPFPRKFHQFSNSYFSKVLRYWWMYGNIFVFFDFHRSSKIFRWHWDWMHMK